MNRRGLILCMVLSIGVLLSLPPPAMAGSGRQGQERHDLTQAGRDLVDYPKTILFNLYLFTSKKKDFLRNIVRGLKSNNLEHGFDVEKIRVIRERDVGEYHDLNVEKKIKTLLRLDLNGDGKLDNEEMNRPARGYVPDYDGVLHAHRADADRDGEVSSQEIEAQRWVPDAITVKGRGMLLAELVDLLEFDIDGDGAVSPEELRRAAGRVFDLADTDGDGVLSRAEKRVVKRLANRPDRPTRMLFRLAGDAELHVVALGAERRDDVAASGRPTVPITIERPRKRVVLLLLSRKPVVWQLRVGAGTTLTRVLAGSRTFAQSSVEVNGHPAVDVGVFPTLAHAHRPEGAGFRNLLHDIRSFTGRTRIDGFLGGHRPPVGGFRLQRVQEGPSLSVDYLQPEGEGPLAYIKFPAIIHSEPGQYNIYGKYLNKRFAYKGKYTFLEPRLGKIFHIDANSLNVYRNVRKREFTTSPGPDFPRFRGVSGMTYDPRNDRVVISTNGRVGRLIAYHLATDRWSVLAELGGLKIGRIAYDDQNGGFVALGQGLQRNALTVHELDAEGRRRKSWVMAYSRFPGLQDLFEPDDWTGADIQVFVRGRYLVFLASALPWLQQGVKRIYLYDRERKTLTLTWADQNRLFP